MKALFTRAENRCELCESTTDLAPFMVAPHTTEELDHTILVCGTCRPELEPDATLTASHWFCLQGAIWSPVSAVQVVALRLLNRLKDDSFAADLLTQAYVEDEVRAWALVDANEGAASSTPVDSNGTALSDGDDVTLIKDLDVKGANFVAKRGTMVKGIRTTDNPEHVEGKVNGVQIVLKTCFLKHAG